MLEFLFDLPLIITGPAIIGSLCLFAVVGLRIVRRQILPHLHIPPEDSHFTATMVHSVMVLYGLAAALMAVNVSETYSDVSRIVSGEATALAAPTARNDSRRWGGTREPFPGGAGQIRTGD